VRACAAALTCAAALGLILTASAGGAPAFKVQAVASRLDQPTWVGAPNGDARLFVAERSGRLLVFVKGRKRTFLDLRGPVESAGGEQGLLAVAFHGKFASNGRMWVYYTGAGGDGRVVEYRASGNAASPRSARRILNVPLGAEADNHNGGQLAYRDGKLWISIGDGGGAGDPDNHAQDRTDLRGKLLRIDVDRGSPYRIPPNNPYGADSGFRREIYALGLRNPFRFSIDPPTGDVWIGDVGQGEREEIDRLRAGRPGGTNFGWGRFEGSLVYNAARALAAGTVHRGPAYEYTHADGACSITGGLVYRGPLMRLRGYYLYADFCKAWIGGFTGNGKQAFRRNVGVNGISAFGTGPGRHVYLASLGQGRVYRIAG